MLNLRECDDTLRRRHERKGGAVVFLGGRREWRCCYLETGIAFDRFLYCRVSVEWGEEREREVDESFL